MFRLRNRVYWAIYLTPFVVGVALMFVLAAVAGDKTAEMLAVPLAVWMIFGLVISRWLVPAFVSRLRCPGCGEEVDPRGVWNCSCGYHDHKMRHVLSFRCPKCKGGIGYIDCPKCEATIMF